MKSDLTIVTWMWGGRFGASDVRKLRDSVRRNLRRPHRFLCVTDADVPGVETAVLKDPGLTRMPGCFARLRLFDDVWQRDLGVTGRIAQVDLDTVVVGELDPVFDRDEPFVIMSGANASNPCPFNGALQMLDAGYRPDVWDDFTLDAAKRVPYYAFPDDQGWLHHKVPDAATWVVGPEHGVYVFKKPGWPEGLPEGEIPEDARLVTFINRTPAMYSSQVWVRENWREG